MVDSNVSAGTRLRAAEVVLSQAAKANEIEDIETRVANWLLRRCPQPIGTEAAEIKLGRTKRMLAAELDISLVDYTGAVAEGRLKPGDNPDLMTIELVLEEL